MGNPAQDNLDERDLRIIILEQSHSFNNAPGSGVNPHYIPNQQEAALEVQLAARMRENPELRALVENNARVDQVAPYLQIGNQGGGHNPVQPVRIELQEPYNTSSQNNSFAGFGVNFGENLKNFFSTSFGWFTDMLSNVFSCFGVGDHNNHDDNIQNIEQMDAHSFSWSDLISNLSRSLLNTISYLSISLGIEQVRQEPAAEQRQDNLNLEVAGEEQEALL